MFLHVSFDPVEKFTPRIPRYRCKGEDASIPRICLSDEIIRALRGIPDSGYIVGMYKHYKIPLVIHVYTLERKIGLLACRKENLRKGISGCIKKGKLPVLDYLFLRDMVPDALVTHECWLLSRPEMEDFKETVYIIQDAVIEKTEDMFGNEGYYIEDITLREITGQPAIGNRDMFLNHFHIDSKQQIRLDKIIRKYGFYSVVANIGKALERRNENIV